MHRNLLGSILAAGSAAAIAHASPARAQIGDEQIYSLPAQDLSISLREVAARSGRSIIAPSELVEKRKAPAVSGPFTAEGAVRLLLTGSGLKVRRVGNSLVIGPEEVQDPATQPEAGRAAEAPDNSTIIVTGTHVRGAQPTSPTIVIDRNQIDRTGATSVEQLMRKIPQNSAGGVNQENFNVPGAGADITEHGAGVNLRGLGQRATLVLLNGRRLAPSGAGSFVDVSLIPITAVDRVEIVTDGASAIYGSDAVGGVVNFILRKRFDGVETVFQAGSGTSGEGSQILASVTAGRGWRNGRALLSYEYRRDQPILARDRDYTINLRPGWFLFPRERRHSLFAVVDQDLSDRIHLQLTGTWGSRETGRSYFFSGTPIPVFARAKARSAGVSGSLAYDLGGTWSMEITGSYFDSRTRQDQEQPGGQGLVNRLDTRNLLGEGGLKIDGSLFEIPGGAVKLAVGAQIRHEKFRSVFETQVNFPNPQRGERNVHSGYAEIHLPLVSSRNRRPGLEQLIVTGAVRAEHYSRLKTSIDPKVGLLWSPVSGLRLRGSYDTSFRAPLLSETLGFYNAFLFPAALLFVRPSESTGGVGAALVGSNPAVRPETSRTWTLGAEFEPSFAPGLRAGANFYSIRFSNRIALPTQQIVVVGDPALEPIVSRGPSAAAVADLLDGAGQVLDFSGPGFTDGGATPADVTVIVDARFNNSAITATRGLDFSLAYDFRLGESRFGADVNANHVIAFDDRLTTSSPVVHARNTPYHPIEWRVRGGLTWALGGWSASLFADHVPAYRDNRRAEILPVRAFTTFDASLVYRFAPGATAWLKNTALTFTAQNLFDADPPRLLPDPGTTGGIGYDPVNASGRGRVLAVQIRKSW